MSGLMQLRDALELMGQADARALSTVDAVYRARQQHPLFLDHVQRRLGGSQLWPPQVLIAVIGVLLHYLIQGADYILLDAMGYLWKEVGTRCIHLPRTHLLVKLFRAICDEVAPGTVIITETNVPHQDNISYSYIRQWPR